MLKKLYFLLFVPLFFISCSNDDNSVQTTVLTRQDSIKLAIKQYADSMVANSICPGLVVGVWDNSSSTSFEYEYAAGKADVANNIPMTTGKIFKVGSNTKTFVVTVLLQLVQEGKLSLDDTLSKYYPDLPHSSQITIRMLANMTSCYESYEELAPVKATMKSNPRKVWTPTELVEAATWSSLRGTPGYGFYYSNTNTFIIGMLIEKLTGNTLESEVKTRIIDKLSLSNTSFLSGYQMSGDYAHGYGENADSTAPLPDVTERYDASLAWAAGGISSDIYNLKTYVNALAKGSLISAAMQTERLKTVPSNLSNVNYGLGIMELAGFVGHYGSVPGYKSLMFCHPTMNTTIIVFYNTQSDNVEPADFGMFILSKLLL